MCLCIVFPGDALHPMNLVTPVITGVPRVAGAGATCVSRQNGCRCRGQSLVLLLD